MTFVGPSSGSYDGNPASRIAPNLDGAPRTMQVRIAGQDNAVTVTIAQAPLPDPAPVPALSGPLVLALAALLASVGVLAQTGRGPDIPL